MNSVEGELQDSKEFARVMDSAFAFLNMPPKAESYWPEFLRKARHQHKIGISSGDSQFWSLMSKDSLLAHGFADDDIESETTQMIAARVMKLTMNQTAPPKDQFRNLVKTMNSPAMPENCILSLDKILCGLTLGQERLQKWQPLTPPSVDGTDSTTATCPIIKAFMAYPAGRLAARQYNAFLETNTGLESDKGIVMARIRKLNERCKPSDELGGSNVLLDAKEEFINLDTPLKLITNEATKAFIVEHCGGAIREATENFVQFMTHAFFIIMEPYLQNHSLVASFNTLTEPDADIRSDLQDYLEECVQVNYYVDFVKPTKEKPLVYGFTNLFRFMASTFGVLQRIGEIDNHEKRKAISENDATVILALWSEFELPFLHPFAMPGKQAIRDLHKFLLTPTRLSLLTCVVTGGVVGKLNELRFEVENIFPQGARQAPELHMAAESFAQLIEGVARSALTVGALDLECARKLKDSQLSIQTQILKLMFDCLLAYCRAASFFKENFEKPEGFHQKGAMTVEILIGFTSKLAHLDSTISVKAGPDTARWNT